MPYKFTANQQEKTNWLQASGRNVFQMNVVEVIGLKQAQKAILKSDTFAFANLMNQALGLPTQELTGRMAKP